MTRNKILIIKLGALGDVIRTTPILRELTGEIIWVTKRESLPLLSKNPLITRLLIPHQIQSTSPREAYDLVVSLDDDFEACEIASRVKKNQLIGAYLNNKMERDYTDDSANWFDMGLISKLGLEKANELKKMNTKAYQEFLFEMLGLKFSGQEYVFPFRNKKPLRALRIGIEPRVGDRWSMKKWPGYEKLHHNLLALSADAIFFEQRPNLESYINDVNQCDTIVTGDTLCMHLGLVLRKQVIALFGPTSADEIYDYGRLTKIVSPAPCIKCYRKLCRVKPSCMDMITIDSLKEAIRHATKRLCELKVDYLSSSRSILATR